MAVIDYDRLVLGGSRKFYVSFDNVKVGTLIGNGLVSCVANWKVAKPQVAVMVGSPTDNNATLFAQGYNAVLAPKFSSGAYIKAATPAGTWDPPTAETEFQQALTAHPGINAAVVPNDENAAPIITYLKTLGTPANKFPITGQDATLIGIQNIISGYQCGTVYKPIYLEAQAAAALALYLRAGKTAARLAWSTARPRTRFPTRRSSRCCSSRSTSSRPTSSRPWSRTGSCPPRRSASVPSPPTAPSTGSADPVSPTGRSPSALA